MDNPIRELKYIGFYDLPGQIYKRVSTLAASNKMDYICDAINRAGFKVHLVSPSWYDDDAFEARFHHQNTLRLSDHKRVTFCPSFGTKIRWVRNLKIILAMLWLFFWLLKNVRRNEKVLVYHVQWLSLPLRWAKSLKGFKIILEVEEIYEQVWGNIKLLQIWEQKLLIAADYYIAVSDVLSDILGDKVKAIIYGSYYTPKLLINPTTDEKVNLIYAGSIDSLKGGALNAIDCAPYLPKEYILHICGFGGVDEIAQLKKNINKINTQLGREACIFHGVKIGNEYTKLLSSCKIALNSQIDGKYMDTAFPSKVISYLAHNLRVVSTRIKSIERSPLASIITFSETDAPESIVSAIMNVHLDENYNSISLIKELDLKFIESMNALLNSNHIN